MLHFDDYLDFKVKNNPLYVKLPDVEISPIVIPENTLVISEKCRSLAFMKPFLSQMKKSDLENFGKKFIRITAYWLITSFRSSLSTIPSRRRITRWAWSATSSS